jgi:cytochrome P450
MALPFAVVMTIPALQRGGFTAPLPAPSRRAAPAGSAGPAQAAFRDPRLSADRITGYRDQLDEDARRRFEATFDLLSRWAVCNDPPEHTRLRGLVHKAFTPRVVAGLLAVRG